MTKLPVQDSNLRAPDPQNGELIKTPDSFNFPVPVSPGDRHTELSDSGSKASSTSSRHDPRRSPERHSGTPRCIPAHGKPDVWFRIVLHAIYQARGDRVPDSVRS